MSLLTKENIDKIVRKLERKAGINLSQYNPMQRADLVTAYLLGLQSIRK